MEQEIELEQENIIISSGGGAVNSVNGYTGDVVLTTSDLENTSDYQTGDEVDAAIADAVAGKQDTLTAGSNISIQNNVISATDTKYTAGNGINISNQNAISANTTVLATKQDVSNEATIRENADTNLQGQIDALSAASDVTDIVGTYADLQNYDTQHLKDNDIIKVLQDESQNDETTYYRWSTTTQTFTLIGEEGPYYTKSATDLLLADKQDKLTAGSNITIDSNNEISATNTTYSAGTGLDLTGTTFSVDTTAIQPKLTAGSNITIDGNNEISATDTTYSAGSGLDLNVTTFSVDTTTIQPKLTPGANISIDSNNEISATDTTYSDFVGTDGTAVGVHGLVPAPATTDAGKFLKADGTWASAGGGGGVTVVQTTGTSTTDVMSQNAASSMVFADPGTDYKIEIGGGASATGTASVAIGRSATVGAANSVAIGYNANTAYTNSVAIGRNAKATLNGEFHIGSGTQSNGYLNTSYRLLTGVYDGQSAHDAVTVGQVNATIDAINTALSTSIPHIGA